MDAFVELARPKRKRRSEKMRHIWHNPVFRDKQHLAKLRSKRPPGWLKKMPTYPELLLNWLTPDIVIYTGDRLFWVDLPNGRRRNPDFVVLGQRRVIELLGDYWHRGFVKTDVEKLIEMYWRAGLECLIVWEKDMKDNVKGTLEEISSFIEE